MSQWADMELKLRELKAYGSHWKQRAEAAEEMAKQNAFDWADMKTRAEAAEAERNAVRMANESLLANYYDERNRAEAAEALCAEHQRLRSIAEARYEAAQEELDEALMKIDRLTNRGIEDLRCSLESAEAERDARLTEDESRVLAFKVTDLEAEIARLREHRNRLLVQGLENMIALMDVEIIYPSDFPRELWDRLRTALLKEKK